MQTTSQGNQDQTRIGSNDGRNGGPNVGTGERWASLIGGCALAAFGLSRRSLGGLGIAAVGGALAKRGATGTCELYSALGVNTAQNSDGQTRTGVPVKKKHHRQSVARGIVYFLAQF